MTPNKFRPASKVGDMVSEHPQNSALVSILNTNIALVELSKKHLANPTEAFPVDTAARTWLTLQRAVTMLLDSSKARKGEATNTGIRQQLEKKEGLFRKNMMGKRVNFAARSVISPDPLIATDEIGVPPYFATRLTFPELVTPMNVNYLRDLVVNGPKEHPGANAVEDERGNLVRTPPPTLAVIHLGEAGGRATYSAGLCSFSTPRGLTWREPTRRTDDAGPHERAPAQGAVQDAAVDVRVV